MESKGCQKCGDIKGITEFQGLNGQEELDTCVRCRGLIHTSYGLLEEKLIAKGKKSWGYENENETCETVEYWIEGVLVHRSVNTKLKKGLFGAGVIVNF